MKPPYAHQTQSPIALDPSLSEVFLKVGSVQRAGSFAPIIAIKSFLDSRVYSGVIDHIHVASRAGLELKFVVGREVGEVFDLEAITVTHLRRSSCLLVSAVTGSGSTEDPGVAVGGIVNPDNNIFPVVSVAAIEATVRDLVFRHIKGIHNSVAALVPASASVSLAVRRIVAASA